MNPRAHILQNLLAALLPLAVAGPLPLFAAPPPQPGPPRGVTGSTPQGESRGVKPMNLEQMPNANTPQGKTEIQPAVSVFAYPNNTSEGRDPFFPASSRLYAISPDNQARAPSLTDLVVKAIIGTPPRVFAIINNHTFAPGDEGDVTLKAGRRLHIHCLDINPKAGTVTVEASGASVVLKFAGSP
jgi:hypothetical protein